MSDPGVKSKVKGSHSPRGSSQSEGEGDDDDDDDDDLEAVGAVGGEERAGGTDE